MVLLAPMIYHDNHIFYRYIHVIASHHAAEQLITSACSCPRWISPSKASSRRHVPPGAQRRVRCPSCSLCRWRASRQSTADNLWETKQWTSWKWRIFHFQVTRVCGWVVLPSISHDEYWIWSQVITHDQLSLTLLVQDQFISTIVNHFYLVNKPFSIIYQSFTTILNHQPFWTVNLLFISHWSTIYQTQFDQWMVLPRYLTHL